MKHTNLVPNATCLEIQQITKQEYRLEKKKEASSEVKKSPSIPITERPNSSTSSTFSQHYIKSRIVRKCRKYSP